MRKPSTFAIALAAGLFVLGQTSVAQTGQAGAGDRDQHDRTKARDDQRTQITSEEQRFVREAYAGHLGEVAIARLADKRAKSDDVKQYGQHLLEEHRQAGDKLREIARENKIDLQHQPGAQHQQTLQRLEGLRGEQFDRAFLQAVDREHRKDIEKYRRMSQQAQNEKIREYASNTLQTLEQHHGQAQNLMREIGVANGAPMTNGVTQDQPGVTPRPQERDQDRDRDPAARLTAEEQKFMRDAYARSLGALALGRIADERAQNDDVRQFGERMLKEHREASDNLRQMAREHRVTLPQQPESRYQSALNKLQKLTGQQFDRTFLQVIEQEKDRDVAAYRQISEKAKAEPLRDWSKNTLQKVEQHHERAQTLRQEVANGRPADNGVRPRTDEEKQKQQQEQQKQQREGQKQQQEQQERRP